MTAAWFGIIGVLVGGLVSTMTALFSEVRKELNDAVVAARIIDSDLLQTALGASASDKQRGELWETHRVALARALGHRQWKAVAAAYQTNTVTPTEAAKATGEARCMLKPVVTGKRFVITQRFGNLFERRSSSDCKQ